MANYEENLLKILHTYLLAAESPKFELSETINRHCFKERLDWCAGTYPTKRIDRLAAHCITRFSFRAARKWRRLGARPQSARFWP
jgi:hypothetical protein